MKKVVKLTESDLMRIVKRIINESEKDTGKFDDYALEQFKIKRFKRVTDTHYTRKEGSLEKGIDTWDIKYKFFPKESIDGFVATKNGKVVKDAPSDDCWVWFSQTF